MINDIFCILLISKINNILTSDIDIKEKRKKGDISALSSDYELMKKVASKDNEAQILLLKRIKDRVRNIARYIINDDFKADDMAQECLIAVLTSAPNYRGEGSIEKWSDIITVRTIFKLIKKEKRMLWVDEPEEEQIDDKNVEETNEQLYMRRRLSMCMEKLNYDQKITLVFKYSLEYSEEEISELMGVSIHTVKQRLKIGRKKLKKILLHDTYFKETVEE